jgi:hypothetical protein
MADDNPSQAEFHSAEAELLAYDDDEHKRLIETHIKCPPDQIAAPAVEWQPGHWGGWELETYPVITEIQFTNAERTRASARVTIGYSGGTVELEKEAGKWIAKRLTSQWIT